MNVGQFVNQNSYALSAAVIIVVIGSEIVRREITLRSIGLLALFAVALVLPVLLLRSPQAAAAELDGVLASGKPVLLQLHSEF